MANYNTFVVIDCKKRKSILVTSSARKAKNGLHTGIKVEVWNNGICTETIYEKQIANINKYVSLEKQYIADKQAKAELRNDKRRKCYGI